MEATSADRSVLDAIEFIMANRHLNREHVPDQLNGKPLKRAEPGPRPLTRPYPAQPYSVEVQ
jgi:hypothetical protein